MRTTLGNLYRGVILLGIVFIHSAAMGASDDPGSRWHISPEGGIVWKVAKADAHADFIEMNGEKVGLVVRYKVDTGGFYSVNPDVVWPMLRFHPNATGSQLREAFGEDARIDQDDRFSVGFFPNMSVPGGEVGSPLLTRTLARVRINGSIQFEGTLNFEGGTALAFARSVFPCVDQPVVIDTTLIHNTTGKEVALSVDEFQQVRKTSAERGIYGAYTVTARVQGAGTHILHPGEFTRVSTIFEAHQEGETPPTVEVEAESRLRDQRVAKIRAEMTLNTPDPVLNTAFELAKLHATESIFRTRGGLLHSPGGGRRYYAAIWANDQAEYTNPFFGMLGDPVAKEAAVNSFRHFARFMNPEYRPIPSSVISEGQDVWNGAGDRGDMAMIAYGASRFALANGDRRIAEELWPLIEWCLEYLRRQVTPAGVVASDSDELEGRFPAGKANLNTSSLYYDALSSAVYLGAELGKSRKQIAGYAGRATAIRAAIEQYFGANVNGFRTYRYYNKADLVNNQNPLFASYASRPDVLRSWIATPLTVGIMDRKEGTLDALFSSHLWSADGAVTEEGDATYWDRSTLYVLRGALAAGATERGLGALRAYSTRRLLGEHVPYPVEASSAYGGAQLAAESALYCRVFSEGLFGIRPTGLNTFDLTPRLPQGWGSMSLKNVHAFGSVFDLEVLPDRGGRLKVIVSQVNERVRTYEFVAGATQSIRLATQLRSGQKADLSAAPAINPREAST